MFKRFVILFLALVLTGQLAFAQNTNSSTTTPVRPRSTNLDQQNKPTGQQPTSTENPAMSPTSPKTTQRKPVVATASDGVLTAFNKLLEGIRHANLNEVTSVYWNSPRLSLFNYNGSVTKGWDQVYENRRSSYPEIKDVKLDVRDVSVTMLGNTGALVTCQWTQSQIYKGNPETASGRMTLVFKLMGNAWKAIHLHSSPDSPNPAVIPPSEQISPGAPSPTPTPSPRR